MVAQTKRKKKVQSATSGVVQFAPGNPIASKCVEPDTKNLSIGDLAILLTSIIHRPVFAHYRPAIDDSTLDDSVYDTFVDPGQVKMYTSGKDSVPLTEDNFKWYNGSMHLQARNFRG